MPQLPNAPSLEWLRKSAKHRLDALRHDNPAAQLADAQFEIAKEYGFASWRALKAHIELLGIEGQLIAAAESGDVEKLRELLDTHPDKLRIRTPPYGGTLLHLAAAGGHLAAVDLLLARGADVNDREGGDNSYPLHWAAGGGHLDVVRRLAAAGGDVIGAGDDHELEVIGWATCWDEQPIETRRAVAEFLISRGARHHIFSAIALNLPDEVRRIVTADPAALNRRQSRNENNRTPLQFAVVKQRTALIALLLELGADPLAVDGGGQPAATYASAPDTDRPIMERIRDMTSAELVSAARGHRAPRAAAMDLLALLALEDFDTAAELLRANPSLIEPAGGVLHRMAKRNDGEAVKWLLDHGADPNGRWAHWDSDVTPLHLAVMEGHVEIVRLLRAAGADPTIRDSLHDSDAIGWARFFERGDIVAMLEEGRP